MNSVLILINAILDLYQTFLIVYIFATWLISFNIVNTSNRLVHIVMGTLYRICEPSLKVVRKYLPNFGSIDLSPIVILLLIFFIRNLLNEYWPRY